MPMLSSYLSWGDILQYFHHQLVCAIKVKHGYFIHWNSRFTGAAAFVGLVALHTDNILEVPILGIFLELPVVHLYRFKNSSK